MPRRSLIEALERLPRVPFEGTVFRHIALRYEALDAEGARVHGGRWNPMQSFPVLYTAPDRDVVFAEIRRNAAMNGLAPKDLLPRKLVSYHVRLQRVLDLTSEASLSELNLSAEMLTGHNVVLTQAIGDAAHYIGYEGILAPSAATRGTTLPVFPYRLTSGSSIEPVETKIIDDLPLKGE